MTTNPYLIWIGCTDIDHVDFCGAVTLLGSSKIKETGSRERIEKDKGKSRLGLLICAGFVVFLAQQRLVRDT